MARHRNTETVMTDPANANSLDDVAKIRLKCLEIAAKFSPDSFQLLSAAKQLEEWVLTKKPNVVA